MTNCDCDTMPSNVGVGTAPDPAVNVTIAGVQNYNTGLRLAGSADNGVGLVLDNAAGRKYDLIATGAANGAGAGAFAVFDETAYVYRLVVAASGNVGIGVTAPGENLTIGGVQYYNAGLKLTGGTAHGVGMAVENTAAGGRKYDLISTGSDNAAGAGAFAIYDETINAYRLTVSPAGNIGVGTDSPAHPLDVSGDLNTSGGLLASGRKVADGGGCYYS